VPAAVLILTAVAVACVPAASALAAARWPRRSPAAAIVLWQALGLGWGLAAVGGLAALGADQRPGVAQGAYTLAGRLIQGRGVIDAGAAGLPVTVRLLFLATSVTLFLLLSGALVAASAAVLRARRRQRALLNLLAHGDPKVPGALVVDYPAAAAYCVPGLRSAIVISAGTLALLDQAELTAVLAHERAHLRERHDLVLLPFTALLRAFRWSAVARAAYAAVAMLVEMLADDRALRHRPVAAEKVAARELATALLRFGAAGGAHAPLGGLAAADRAADGQVAARVSRLLRPAPRLPWPSVVLVCAAAALIVAIPAGFLLLPS
jgi:beta-lactamase regulating signal transducer with metallopeptidase domain